MIINVPKNVPKHILGLIKRDILEICSNRHDCVGLSFPQGWETNKCIYEGINQKNIIISLKYDYLENDNLNRFWHKTYGTNLWNFCVRDQTLD